MIKTGTSCFKVSDIKICVCCKSDKIIKNGFTKNKKQQYYCKDCRKRFIDFYTYRAYDKTLNKQIIALTKEGLGILTVHSLLLFIKHILIFVFDFVEQGLFDIDAGVAIGSPDSVVGNFVSCPHSPEGAF